MKNTVTQNQNWSRVANISTNGMTAMTEILSWNWLALDVTITMRLIKEQCIHLMRVMTRELINTQKAIWKRDGSSIKNTSFTNHVWVQSLVCIDKDESRNIFTDITSIFLVDLFSFFNIYCNYERFLPGLYQTQQIDSKILGTFLEMKSLTYRPSILSIFCLDL